MKAHVQVKWVLQLTYKKKFKKDLFKFELNVLAQLYGKVIERIR